jgi:hypothetical protein
VISFRVRHLVLTFLSGIVFASAVTSTTPQAASAAAAAASTKPRVVCTAETHADAASDKGTAYAVRPGNWDTPLCLRLNGKPDFTLTQNVVPDRGRVVAFPSVLYGAFASILTKGSVLPRKISRLGGFQVSWWTHGAPAGAYNRAMDMWFHSGTPAITRPGGKISVPHGTAEVMIWIGTHGYPSWSRYPKVRIDGAEWYVDSWMTKPATGKGWPITIFRRVHETRHASHLAIVPFIRATIRRHMLGAGDELLSAAFGSETSIGGRGLGVSLVRVNP